MGVWCVDADTRAARAPARARRSDVRMMRAFVESMEGRQETAMTFATDHDSDCLVAVDGRNRIIARSLNSRRPNTRRRRAAAAVTVLRNTRNDSSST